MGADRRHHCPKAGAATRVYRQIPCAPEQGIFQGLIGKNSGHNSECDHKRVIRSLGPIVPIIWSVSAYRIMVLLLMARTTLPRARPRGRTSQSSDRDRSTVDVRTYGNSSVRVCARSANSAAGFSCAGFIGGATAGFRRGSPAQSASCDPIALAIQRGTP